MSSLSKGIWFMAETQIRKRFLSIEEIFHEGGPVAETPLRRAAALVVIRNPFAGAYVEKIESFMDDLKPLGLTLARSLVDALGGGINIKAIEGYGNGGIVGGAAGVAHGAWG